jgi:hypothetical protein
LLCLDHYDVTSGMPYCYACVLLSLFSCDAKQLLME